MWRFKHAQNWFFAFVAGYIAYCTYSYYLRGDTWTLLIPALVFSLFVLAIWKTPRWWLER